MVGDVDQSQAAGEECGRNGKRLFILGCWLMITHRRPAGVDHERNTVVSKDEEAAGPTGCLIDARSKAS
jgi:hypothetical protein